MEKNLVYLDSYIVQQDLRVRLSKSILTNLDLEAGKSFVDFYFDVERRCVVLKKGKSDEQ